MIAHRIERTGAKKGGYAVLATYIADVKKDAVRDFTRTADYIADVAGGGERVVGVRITNCGADDFALALAEIAACQDENTRSRKDKTYHLVVSFPEGERPTLERLRDIEDELCRSIGLADHQRISAIHDDTDNLHVHVAINLIHPETKRHCEPYFDKQKLMAACIELEVKHGLERVSHGIDAERAHERAGGQRAEKMEHHGGRESLRSWIIENAAAALIEAAASAQSWEALHQAFAENGLELRPQGAGLVISAIGDRTAVKASAVSPTLSHASLTGRLGAYERPGPAAEATKPKQAYTRAARHRTPEVEALFARYQQERGDALKSRAHARADMEQAHAVYTVALKAHHQARRVAIRQETHLRGDERRHLRTALAHERKGDWAARRTLARDQRQQIDAAHPLLTWQAFLEREAGRGDEHALAALRSRAVTARRMNADILTAPDLKAARHVIDKRHTRTARHNGDMLYQLQDGGRVTDRAAEVRLDQLSTGAALLALTLAAERFQGQALVLDGSDAFKAAIVQVAATPGLTVRFADPELERARQVAEIARRREAESQRAPTNAAEYVAERNARREGVGDVAPHRLWTAGDAGDFTYAGRRAFADGSEAVLLRRGEEVVVKPSTDAQVAKASRWRRGEAVTLDARGRFLGRGGKASTRGADEQGR